MVLKDILGVTGMLRLGMALKSNFSLFIFFIICFTSSGTVLSCETATIESSDGANVCLDQFLSILGSTCYLEKESKTQAQFDWGTKDCREPRAIREEIRRAKKAIALAVTLSPDSPQIAFSMDAYKTWKDFNDAYALDRCEEIAISNRINLDQYPCVLLGGQTNRRDLMHSDFSQQEITAALTTIDESIEAIAQKNDFEKQTRITDNSIESELDGIDVSAGSGPNGSCQSVSIRSSDGGVICLDNFPVILEKTCRESGYAKRAYLNRNLGTGYRITDCDGGTYLQDIDNAKNGVVFVASDTPAGFFYSFAVDGVWNTRPVTELLAIERCRQYLTERYISKIDYPCVTVARSLPSNPRILVSEKSSVEMRSLLSQIHEEIINPHKAGSEVASDQLHEDLVTELAKEKEEIEAQRQAAKEERNRLKREYELALKEVEQERSQIAEEVREREEKRLELERQRLENEQKIALQKLEADRESFLERVRIAEAERSALEEKIKKNEYVDERKRVALVVGNSEYRSLPKLLNPSNDVQSMRRALIQANFEVVVYENLDLRGMQDTLRSFGDRLDEDTVGLFYFAGHGMQFEGRNYLVPVNENIVKPYELQTAALDLSLVTNTLKYAGNDLNIVILDACRNNSLSSSRGGDRGFAAVSASEGTFIAFSTAPGEAALDGRGENSPYTKYLAREIELSDGLSIEALFKKVRANVMSETKRKQIPWENSSLLGEFRFK